jgi:hypothetical protein
MITVFTLQLILTSIIFEYLVRFVMYRNGGLYTSDRKLAILRRYRLFFYKGNGNLIKLRIKVLPASLG